MACVDTNDLNKLYAKAAEGKPTVTLKYGVMNVAEQLKELGFGVQLQHDEVGEHYVELIVDGVKLARSDDLQHNRNYSENKNISATLVQKVAAALLK